ncbi:hypothetical protein FB45DRAFT_386324 [Roridomyces roridus]|uniref:Uncharacterized protein n=1 Tax=Roridomyces roridus TaxID=1738132 RepID=A0AAD7B227_9AGAR|nr:hypothetical protein FB45DRAFT_386324 [Roridomyces roridus]
MASKARTTALPRLKTTDSQEIVPKDVSAQTGGARGVQRRHEKPANSTAYALYQVLRTSLLFVAYCESETCDSSYLWGHHLGLRHRIHQFHALESLAGTTPPIKGLDRSMLVDPRRLHFTLDVMALHSVDVEQSQTSNGKTLSVQSTFSRA